VLKVTHHFLMLDSMADLTHIIMVFATLNHAVAVLASLPSHLDDILRIPHDVIAEMVLDTIRKHRIAPLFQKSQSSGLGDGDPNPWKKPELIEYDMERVKNCG
jgi:hypothetical protein